MVYCSRRGLDFLDFVSLGEAHFGPPGPRESKHLGRRRGGPGGQGRGMADGQILLTRSIFPQSRVAAGTLGFRVGNRRLRQYEEYRQQRQEQHRQHRVRGIFDDGGGVRKVGPQHKYCRRHHHQERQQERRLGGADRIGSSLGLCKRVMASAAGRDSSAAAAHCQPSFESYSVPSENWRAKKQGGSNQQCTCGNGGVNSKIHVNGAASNNGSSYGSNVLYQIPKFGDCDLAEECEAKAFELQSSANSLRPKRIILVRHGQSEGNVDESVYTRVPDSKIELTEEGWKQAIQCGKTIRELIERDEVDDWKVYFYVSPYRRTLQTLRGIGLAFNRDRIAGVREEPRIREQDFGNFQDREKMRVEKEVRLRYGRFFYRFPNGESAADVYDRITGFRETLRADVDVGRFQRPEARCKNMNLVMVSHGLTLRVFLMRWFKWTVQQFEGLWNFGNTGMMIMELGPGGRYSLTMHHSAADLKAFGMTDDMIADQEWQKYAKPGELNQDWLTSGASFFTHFDDIQNGCKCDEIPPDIMQNVLGVDAKLNPEPPTVE